MRSWSNAVLGGLVAVLAGCAPTGSDRDGHCQSVFARPPTVAVGGVTSCDGVTFAVVSGPANIPATPFTVETTRTATDAGSGCEYALVGLAPYAIGPIARTFTISISQPGFAPASTDVTTGYGGCFGEAAPSRSEVTLTPLSPDSDGGVDGG